MLLLKLFNNNYNYTSCVNWEVEKTPETYVKKLEFNINKSETGLKKIDLSTNVIDGKIDDMNNKIVVYPSDDLTNNNYSNIEDQ